VGGGPTGGNGPPVGGSGKEIGAGGVGDAAPAAPAGTAACGKAVAKDVKAKVIMSDFILTEVQND
jgi:hypothetical protein